MQSCVGKVRDGVAMEIAVGDRSRRVGGEPCLREQLGQLARSGGVDVGGRIEVK